MFLGILCFRFTLAFSRFVFSRVRSLFLSCRRLLAFVVACIFTVRRWLVNLTGVILELRKFVIAISDNTSKQGQFKQGPPKRVFDLHFGVLSITWNCSFSHLIPCLSFVLNIVGSFFSFALEIFSWLECFSIGFRITGIGDWLLEQGSWSLENFE